MSEEKKNKPTIGEVLAPTKSKTRKKSIKLDFIDNALIVLTKFDQGKGSLSDKYIVNVLYTNLFDKLKDDEVNMNLTPTSIYNIFVLLGATPRKKTKIIKENYMFYNEDIIGTLSNTKSFYLQAIFSMLNMINVSVYLYRKLALIGREDIQGAMMKFLIVAASNTYEELYSKNGKIMFPYYFKKVIQYNTNLDTEITPYKSSSWRSEYDELTKDAKMAIDEILMGEDTKTIYIENIALTVGKIVDKRINPDEQRYIIEAGIADMENNHYDRIFISTIKE